MFSDGIHQTSFIMLLMIFAFAVIHSGGAAIRSKVENFIGARTWRLVFAGLSIPSASLLILYFLAHRYDGIRLWNVQGIPGVIPFVWIASAISFLFLYPATYNLLEIPALAKPTVRLYANGIIRISRHPQAIGQIIWCIAHCLWIGSSFMIFTCLGLIAHHLFAVWHGDRRLKQKFGDQFEELKKNTSIIPFLAVFDGRQKLVLKEFLRPSQLGICLAIAFFWWSHRFISLGSEVFLSSYFSELFA